MTWGGKAGYERATEKEKEKRVVRGNKKRREKIK